VLHKPPGYVSSLHDPEGRKTIDQLYDDIPERLYPVGRLDYDTEGLLVITNDGIFSQLLQHPRHGIEKKYLVKVRGVPLEAALKRLRDGVVIDGRATSRSQVRLVKKTVKSSWCEVVLHEGLNRQLKKMFELIGHPTIRIIRTAIGPLELGRLPSGAYRFLTKAEIEAVKECGTAGDASTQPVSKQRKDRRPARPERSFRTNPERGRTSAAGKPRTGPERNRTSAVSKPKPVAPRKPASASSKPRAGSTYSRTPARPSAVSTRRPKTTR
jgi:pseudouridine synthase